MIDKKYFHSQTDFNFSGKTVLVRIDCDVDLMEENGKLIVDEDFRLRQAMPTIEFLKEKGAGKIILLGHLGRPEGKVVEELKLAPVAEWFICHSELDSKSELVVPSSRAKSRDLFPSLLSLSRERDSSAPPMDIGVGRNDGMYEIDVNLFLFENLRFDKREEENDENFAKELAGLGDVYINEAFGVSHRENASITGIPKYLPSFLGLNFEREIEVLTRLRSSSSVEAKEKIERPLIFVLGGSKKDKLEYLEFLGEWCDKVLVGGKLPNELKVQSEKFKVEIQNSKLLFAGLKTDGKDLNEEDIRLFKEEINKAKTIVWAGPMGVYEEEENRYGTFEIAKAIVESTAGYKIAGGGDTHRILSWLGIWNKFNFVSCGGGAMLAFFKNQTLSGIIAVQSRKDY